MKTAVFKIWRGIRPVASFAITPRVFPREWLFSMRSITFRQRKRTIWLPLELQSRQMRVVLGRGQRDAKVDVHDPPERFAT